jgi:hypothetical protein
MSTDRLQAEPGISVQMGKPRQQRVIDVIFPQGIHHFVFQYMGRKGLHRELAIHANG